MAQYCQLRRVRLSSSSFFFSPLGAPPNDPSRCRDCLLILPHPFLRRTALVLAFDVGRFLSFSFLQVRSTGSFLVSIVSGGAGTFLSALTHGPRNTPPAFPFFFFRRCLHRQGRMCWRGSLTFSLALTSTLDPSLMAACKLDLFPPLERFFLISFFGQLQCRAWRSLLPFLEIFAGR